MLLVKKRFLPLFLTQFLGAFNDNLMRNALVVLITFKISASSLPADPKILTSLASALLIAPYVVFSSLAGELADKYERSRLMRYTKFFELVVMLVAAYGFYTNDVMLLMGLLFAAGTQATFFSPMKYSVLPTHLGKHELMRGNGLIESGTFLAILTGSISGTLLGDMLDITEPSTSFNVSAALVTVSVIGIVASYFIPVAKAAEPQLDVAKNLLRSSKAIIKAVTNNATTFKAVMFTSWFWLCGSVFLALFPGYVKEVLNAGTHVYAVFLATFSIGIAVGAVVCSRLLKDEITPKYTYISLVGVSVFTLGIVVASSFTQNTFLLAVPMALTAFCWGIYTVPLKTIIQTSATDNMRSRIIAGENIFNAIFMVAAGLINMLLLSFKVDILSIFTIIAVINIGVAIIAKKLWKK